MGDLSIAPENGRNKSKYGDSTVSVFPASRQPPTARRLRKHVNDGAVVRMVECASRATTRTTSRFDVARSCVRDRQARRPCVVIYDECVSRIRDRNRRNFVGTSRANTYDVVAITNRRREWRLGWITPIPRANRHISCLDCPNATSNGRPTCMNLMATATLCGQVFNRVRTKTSQFRGNSADIAPSRRTVLLPSTIASATVLNQDEAEIVPTPRRGMPTR
jgi:hypothetical protein